MSSVVIQLGLLGSVKLISSLYLTRISTCVIISILSLFTGRLRGKYIDLCRDHSIQFVQENRIKTQVFEINEFAVNLTLAVKGEACKEFKDALGRYCNELKEPEREIKMCDLVDDNIRVTFLSGVAGVGKSVLAKKIVHSWANEEMYKNFTLCLYFQCRDLNDFKCERADLPRNEMLMQFIMEKLMGCDIPPEGDGVLIVIDGVDELFDVKEENSIIYEFLSLDKSFRKSSIIITGRPSLEWLVEESCKRIGKYQVVEVKGLCDKGIHTYIEKFSKCNGESKSSNTLEIIMKNINSSNDIRPMLSVPQFLNAICCVFVLNGGENVESTMELYTWTLYLLLNRAYEKRHVSEKATVADVFTIYKDSMLLLGKISFHLYRENKIIFRKKEFHNEFEKISKNGSEVEKCFINGLFVDVSDNFHHKLQFKHLTLMQFMAAIHVCISNDIQELVDKESFEILDYACGLYGGGMSEASIVRVMLDCVVEGDIEEKAKSFMLKVRGALWCKRDINLTKLVKLVSFLPQNIKDKQFLHSLFGTGSIQIHCPSKVCQEHLMKIYKHLGNCGCPEDEIKAVFTNFSVHLLIVSGKEVLKLIKYFKKVRWLLVHNLSLNGDHIKSLDESFVCCDEVQIMNCDLEGMETAARSQSHWPLERLQVENCIISEDCVTTVNEWGVSSKLFTLSKVKTSEEWWIDLLYKASSRHFEGSLMLRNLIVQHCTIKPSEVFYVLVRAFSNWFLNIIDVVFMQNVLLALLLLRF